MRKSTSEIAEKLMLEFSVECERDLVMMNSDFMLLQRKIQAVLDAERAAEPTAGSEEDARRIADEIVNSWDAWRNGKLAEKGQYPSNMLEVLAYKIACNLQPAPTAQPDDRLELAIETLKSISMHNQSAVTREIAQRTLEKIAAKAKERG